MHGWAKGAPPILGGFERTRFVNQPVPDIYSCAICLEVLREPRQCVNHHKFCSSCIAEWTSKNSTCPLGRVELIRPLPWPDADFLESYHKLRLRCVDNCHFVSTIEEMILHEKSCHFYKDARIRVLEEDVAKLRHKLHVQEGELAQLRGPQPPAAGRNQEGEDADQRASAISVRSNSNPSSGSSSD